MEWEPIGIVVTAVLALVSLVLHYVQFRMAHPWLRVRVAGPMKPIDADDEVVLVKIENRGGEPGKVNLVNWEVKGTSEVLLTSQGVGRVSSPHGWGLPLKVDAHDEVALPFSTTAFYAHMEKVGLDRLTLVARVSVPARRRDRTSENTVTFALSKQAAR